MILVMKNSYVAKQVDNDDIDCVSININEVNHIENESGKQLIQIPSSEIRKVMRNYRNTYSIH